MADKQIDELGNFVAIDRATDLLPLLDVSADSVVHATMNQLLGFSGGSPVSTTDTQALSNKTIGITNTVVLVDSLFTLQDNVDNTKQAVFQLSGITTGTTRTYTLPNASGTLADIASAQTFTNKTLTSPILTGGTITNPVLQTDTVSEYTSANGVTVDGLNIKDGKLNTNNSVVTANITDAAVTPAKLVASTGSSWVFQSWTPTFTNFTVGNGVLTAKYVQVGKIVFYRLKFVLGTTSVMSSDPKFSLPVTLNADAVNGAPGGHYVAYDVSATAYYTGVVMESTANDGTMQFVTGGTSLGGWTSTSPFTWTNGDVFQVQGWYEVA